nr:hypothetical protein [Nostoc sp. WHI]
MDEASNLAQCKRLEKASLLTLGLLGLLYNLQPNTPHPIPAPTGLVNPNTQNFWVIDYRIFNPDNDGLTKIDHVKNMLQGLVYQKLLPFDTVLMDTWYAVNNLMLYIDGLDKVYYCPLKTNRLVDDTFGKEIILLVLCWFG